LYSLGYIRAALPHQAMFIKKILFEKYGGYNENLKMVSDWEFYLLSIFKYNCSYCYIDYVISYFNIEGFSSRIENETLQKEERLFVMKKYFSPFYVDFEQRDLLAQNIERMSNSPKTLIKQLLRIIKRRLFTIIGK
jgi:hypothetical protein